MVLASKPTNNKGRVAPSDLSGRILKKLISVLSTYAPKKTSDFTSDQMKSHSDKIPKALVDFVAMIIGLINGFYLESIYQTDGPGVIVMGSSGVGELRPVIADID